MGMGKPQVRTSSDTPPRICYGGVREDQLYKSPRLSLGPQRAPTSICVNLMCQS